MDEHKTALGVVVGVTLLVALPAVSGCSPAHPVAKRSLVGQPGPTPAASVVVPAPAPTTTSPSLPPLAGSEAPVDCSRVHASAGQTPSPHQISGPEHPNFVQDVGLDSPSASPWGLATCEKLNASVKPGQERHCYQSTPPGGAGLWVLDTFERQRPGDASYWQLSYVGVDGKTLRSERFEAGDGGAPAIAGNQAPGVPSVLSVVDYDGDGKQEILTAVTQFIDAAGNNTNILAIWTAGARAIEPFAGTRGWRILSARDTNRDGRFELVVDPYGLRLGSPYGWRESTELWSLLVELDARGRVVRDGSMSRAYARELCPTPAGLLEGLATLSGEDQSCVAGYVHCALLWGVPSGDIDAALTNLCAGESDADSGSWCSYSLDSWQAMTNETPSFVLEP